MQWTAALCLWWIEVSYIAVRDYYNISVQVSWRNELICVTKCDRSMIYGVIANKETICLFTLRSYNRVFWHVPIVHHQQNLLWLCLMIVVMCQSKLFRLLYLGQPKTKVFQWNKRNWIEISSSKFIFSKIIIMLDFTGVCNWICSSTRNVTRGMNTV